jgi:hypothetical protein
MQIFTKNSIDSYLAYSREIATPESPSAVILCTSDDHNCAFNLQTHNFSKTIHDFISNGYKVYFHEMQNADIDGALASLYLRDKSVDILYIAAHGDPTYTRFSSGPEGILHAENIRYLKLKALSAKASICFFSCFAGISVAPAFQKLLPLAHIWAAKAAIYGCLYFQAPYPVFIFDHGPETLSSNDLVNTHVPLELFSPAKSAFQLASSLLSNPRSIETQALAGDVRAKHSMGTTSPKGSRERLFWFQESYQGGNRESLTPLLTEFVSRKFYSLFSKTSLFALNHDHLKSPSDLDYLGKLFAFSIGNRANYDFNFIERMICEIGLYMSPYIKTLKGTAPFSETARNALYLTIPYQSDEAIRLFHQSCILGDQWPYYLIGRTSYANGYINAALFNLKFSNTRESYELIKAIAERTHHPEAFFDLYLRNTMDLTSLYQAAFYGHPHARFILRVQALPVIRGGLVPLRFAGLR